MSPDQRTWSMEYRTPFCRNKPRYMRLVFYKSPRSPIVSKATYIGVIERRMFPEAVQNEADTRLPAVCKQVLVLLYDTPVVCLCDPYSRTRGTSGASSRMTCTGGVGLWVLWRPLFIGSRQVSQVRGVPRLPMCQHSSALS